MPYPVDFFDGGLSPPAKIARSLTYAHPPHKSAPRNAGVNDWDVVGEFRFEDAVEVLAASNGAERVAVGELGEHADLVGVLELGAGRHGGQIAGALVSRVEVDLTGPPFALDYKVVPRCPLGLRLSATLARYRACRGELVCCRGRWSGWGGYWYGWREVGSSALPPRLAGLSTERSQ